MVFNQWEELQNAFRFFESNPINDYLRVSLVK